jgi:hypothetical protein
MSRNWPTYNGLKWDNKPENFPQFNKNIMDFISQPFPFEDPVLQANVKSWNVAAMGKMSFLHKIPECSSSDWNQWDMAILIGETNVKFPNSISSQMKAELLDVEAKLGEYWGPWGAIQRTLFQSLDAVVERKTVLNAINAHDDYFYFSRAMKSFRNRYDAYLAAGENETLLEDRCKTRIRDGAAKIVDSSTFD